MAETPNGNSDSAGKKPGRRGPGKLGGQAKENIAAVFTRLGGTAAMARWAKKNQSEFYRIYARLIPVDTVLQGEDGPLTIVVKRFADD